MCKVVNRAARENDLKACPGMPRATPKGLSFQARKASNDDNIS